MSPERSKVKPNEDLWGRYQFLKKRLEDVQSTGQLLRTAKWILRSWPKYKEEAGAAVALHDPQIFIGDYIIRSSVDVHRTDSGDLTIESLRIDKYIDRKTSQGESYLIEYRGEKSESKWNGSEFVENFEGLSYVETTEMGGNPERDSEHQETVFIGKASDPLRDKDALPKVRGILGKILDGVIDEFEREDKEPLEVRVNFPFALDHNFAEKPYIDNPHYFYMEFVTNSGRSGAVSASKVESGYWDFWLILDNLPMASFSKYKAYIIYNGEKYKPKDIDIDQMQLRKEEIGPLNFFNWQNDKGEEIAVGPDVDVFSAVQFVIEYLGDA